MTIKSKISFYISVIFTVLFGIICLVVISIYSNFRKQEFEDRLNEKALTTIRLLLDVKEVDSDMLKIIDQNSINKLYNEKTLIFDAKFNLIYSSLDDTKIKWSVQDLKFLKENKTFFKQDGDKETYGLFYNGKNMDYYALVSANDNYGNRKLGFLIYLLLSAYFIFTISTWILTFLIVKKQLQPLDTFHQEINNINEQNLNSQLNVIPNNKNEINLLSKEFNFMIKRIAEAYQKQKEFTSQASHELRTPLARITAQIENYGKHTDDKTKQFLFNILNDVTKLNHLIQSLLILSKVDSKTVLKTEKSRLDEAVFNSIDKVTLQFPDFKVNLNLNLGEEMEDLLEINCNQELLEIALTNLLRNACIYSDNQVAEVEFTSHKSQLILTIRNNGGTITEEEQVRLYEPFMRGANSKNKNGLGIGMPIVYRILSLYGFKIDYSIANNENLFKLRF